MKKKQTMKTLHAILFFLLVTVSFSIADDLHAPRDLRESIKKLKSTNCDIGGPEALFDLDSRSLMRTPSRNPAFVMVEFHEPIDVEHIRLILINEKHTVSLFAADSLEELESDEGSCRSIVIDHASQEARVELFLKKPVKARAFKLHVERISGDDYVHICEWQFCRKGRLEKLLVQRVTDRRKAHTGEGLDEVTGIIEEPVNTVLWFKIQALVNGALIDIDDEATWEPLDQGVEPFGDGKGFFLLKSTGDQRIEVRFKEFSRVIRLKGTARELSNRMPDVEIWYIERLPRMDYDGPNDGLPAPGSPVVWRGHLYNWGEEPVDVLFQWRLDEEFLLEGKTTLQPGPPDYNTTFVDLPMNWDDNRHDLSLTLLPPEGCADLVPANNSLAIQTDAITVGFWVEQSLFEFFHEHQHRLPTHDANSFAGWSQRMMRQWNLMFEKALSGSYPRGIEERVRLDRLKIVPDFALPLKGGIPSNNPDLGDRSVDMTWGHESIDIKPGSELPLDHWWSPEKALQAFERGDIRNERMDPPFWCGLGYIHEMAHARYLVDAYGFNVHSGIGDNPAERAIPIRDEKGFILGRYMPIEEDIQHWRKYKGQMGGNYWAWSVFEAMCWNRVRGKRARGGNCNAPSTIGEFLQDIPGKLVYRFSSKDGEPLAGADVWVYRAEGTGKSWYAKQFMVDPSLKKKADENGCVPFDRTLWSANGKIVHTFGWSNAVALLRITFKGQHYFLFEEVTDANLAFNLGHKDRYCFERTIRLRTGEPSPDEWDVDDKWEKPGSGF